MAAPLDPRRIAELEDLLGTDFGSVIDSLEQSIATALADATSALDAGDLAATAYAAHHCRNDALMVGAAELQQQLAALEAAARRDDLDTARATITRVRELWPRAREELARTAQRNASA
jgi:HPt (histidine-containing phosphotransfer) domain-containing protein